MIRYRLKCERSHEFEGWFASSDAFEKQRKKKLVACPKCNSHKVDKALMAPSVVTSEKKGRSRKRSAPAAPVPAPEAAPAGQGLMFNAEQREILKRMKQMRDEVLAKSEYVGPRFAEEARKIHNKETETRGIYGEADPAEVKSLVEDGVDVYPIPVLPDDHN